MMKREMESQMAFQNKMRALKQQELDKYRTEPSATEGMPAGENADREQGAGEVENDDERGRGMSIGEDFLHFDDVDEQQLFEFMLSDTT